MAAGEVLVMTPRMSDVATLSGSSQQTGFERVNMQNMFPHLSWRSTDLTSEFIQIDLGGTGFGGPSTKYRISVALLWTNAREATTWRLRFDDDSAPETSPILDSGTVAMWPLSGRDLDVRFPDGVHAYYEILYENIGPIRYIRIDFTDASHPDGYFEVGRLMVAVEAVVGPWSITPIPVWRPKRGPMFGSGTPVPIEAEDGERSDSGVFYPYERERPVVTGPQKFRGLSRSEVERFADLYRERGASKDVLYVFEPGHPAVTQWQHENLVHGFLRNFDNPTRPQYGQTPDGPEDQELSFEVEGIW